MTDGVLRPRPQPLGRYTLLRAVKAFLPETVVAAVAAGVAVELDQTRLLLAALHNWEDVLLAVFLVAGAVPLVVVAVLVVHVQRKASVSRCERLAGVSGGVGADDAPAAVTGAVEAA